MVRVRVTNSVRVAEHTRGGARPPGRRPLCEKDVQRLRVVAIQGEAPLRIDHCTECRGYLKTCDGEGAEGVLLLDWTSLHLDVIASDRGLERRATSLYDLALAPGAGALDPARGRG